MAVAWLNGALVCAAPSGPALEPPKEMRRRAISDHTWPPYTGIKRAIFLGTVRSIKLTGREMTIVRAIGFADSAIGADIQDVTKMELEDVTDVLNGLIAAGFVESIPYSEDVQMAEIMATAFEVNPAYAHELRRAIAKR
jgi:hypothetical protein